MANLKIEGEALELLDDFIKYAEINTEEIADAMYYDTQGFRAKLRQLKEQVNL